MAEKHVKKARITGVQFGLWSPDDVERLSVATIVTPTDLRFLKEKAARMESDGNQIDHDSLLYGDMESRRRYVTSLSDPSLGVVTRREKCLTCGNGYDHCPGHWGQIQLGLPVFNAYYVKTLARVLRSVCINCCHIMFYPEGNKYYDQITHIHKHNKRITDLAEFIKTRMFRRCWSYQARKQYVEQRTKRRKLSESSDELPEDIEMEPECKSLEDVQKYGKCGAKQPQWLMDDVFGVYPVFDLTEDDFEQWKETETQRLAFMEFRRQEKEAQTSSSKGRKRGKEEVPTTKKRSRSGLEQKCENEPTSWESWCQQKEIQPFQPPTMTPLDIYEILSCIPNDSLRTIGGFNPDEAHPRDMMFKNMMVPPPFVRQSQTNSWQSKSQHNSYDLNRHLGEIKSKASQLRNRLRDNHRGRPLHEAVNLARYMFRDDIHASWEGLFREALDGTPITYQLTKAHQSYQAIQQQVIALQNGKQGKGKKHKWSSLYDRYRKRREGRAVDTLFGKRNDYSARAPIGPDINISIDEVGVPQHICEKLTYPERVNAINLHHLQELVARGPNNYPGANYVITDKGKWIDLHVVDRNSVRLQMGWIVKRQLKKGDLTLFGRQPSLHELSILCHKIIPIPGNCIRTHLATTPGYNADFDGDEMNLFPLQDELTRAEGLSLQLPSHHVMMDGKPVVQFVQNPIAALYLLTARHERMSKERAFQILNHHTQFEFEWIEKLERYERQLGGLKEGEEVQEVSGAAVLSATLDPSINVFYKQEICIENGVLKYGQFKKDSINGRGGILHIMCREKGSTFTARWLEGSYIMLSYYLRFKGLSMSLADCQVPEMKEVEQVKARATQWIHEHHENHDPHDIQEYPLEQFVRQVIEKTELYVGNQVIQHFHRERQKRPRMGLLEITESGAKGSNSNIVQIAGVVGQQQDHTSRRFRHPVPHLVQSDKARGHGWVGSSFFQGLTTPELMSHHRGARVGLAFTAIGTGDSGYTSRKMQKYMEDLKTNIYGHVVDGSGSIVQMQYAINHMDNNHLHKHKCVWYQPQQAYTTSLLPEEVQSRVHTLVEMADVSYRLPEYPNWAHVTWFPVYFPEMRRKWKVFEQTSIKEHLAPHTLWRKMERLWHELKEVVRLSLSHRILWLEYMQTPQFPAITLEGWNMVHDYILTEVMKGLMCTGTPVGLKAAQRLGQKLTQSNLNVFHQGGTNKNTYNIDDFIKCLEHPMFSMTHIYHRNLQATQQDYEFLAHDLVFHCAQSYLAYTRDTLPSNWEERIAMLQMAMSEKDGAAAHTTRFRTHPHQVLIFRLTNGSYSPYQLVSILSEANILNQWEWLYGESCTAQQTIRYEALDVWNIPASQEINEHKWEYGWVACALRKPIKVKGSNGRNRHSYGDLAPNLIHWMSEKVMNTHINGIPGITSVSYRDQHIVAQGHNIRAIMQIPGVDKTRTYSTHLKEMEQYLGIDSVTRLIEEGLTKAMNLDYMDPQGNHIRLLAERMTHLGVVYPANYEGICQEDYSILRATSFEQSMSSFVRGVMAGKHDPCVGFSECIAVNGRQNMGTGQVRLVTQPHQWESEVVQSIPPPSETTIVPPSSTELDRLFQVVHAATSSIPVSKRPKKRKKPSIPSVPKASPPIKKDKSVTTVKPAIRVSTWQTPSQLVASEHDYFRPDSPLLPCRIKSQVDVVLPVYSGENRLTPANCLFCPDSPV